MKILYGIQGTGHGHISRARELLPELSKHASVDVMISGYASQPDLDGNIKFRKYGISLTYDSNGGVSVLDTLRDFRPIRFISDVRSVSLDEYDLVVSDYEPVSSWSAKLQNIPCVGMSHQASFLSPLTPRPEQESLLAETLFQHFAPVDHPIGFHFSRYDDFIEPPIIRSSIRRLDVRRGNHVTVYLPAYHHDMLKEIFAPFSHVDWHIFSPFCTVEKQEQNYWIHPIGNQPFLDSLASCRGVICNAGFETCAEAMYLGKKLLPVPIQKQYEQQCNATAIAELGVKTLDTLKGKSREIWHWLENKQPVRIDEIADPADVVKKLLKIASREHIHPGERSSKGSIFRLVS